MIIIVLGVAALPLAVPLVVARFRSTDTTDDMSEHSAERWNAASGYLVILLGVAGAAFERGSPPLTAPIAELVAFWSTYQRELLAQSVMFVLSAGAYLWFFGSLRSVLMRAERGSGTLSTITFGAGVVSAGLQMILQCLQTAIADADRRRPYITRRPRPLPTPRASSARRRCSS